MFRSLLKCESSDSSLLVYNEWWAQPILWRAHQAAVVKTGQRLVRDLARRLESEYPSAAECVGKGLDETLTVLLLKLPPRLRRSLATANTVDSRQSHEPLMSRPVFSQLST